MLLKVSDQASTGSRFAFWRIVVWLILLAAAYRCLQNAQDAARVWQTLQQIANVNAAEIANLHHRLALDVGLFVLPFALIVVCAGVILHQAWARPILQWSAVLLALVWGVVGAVFVFSQLQDFSHQVALTNAQTSLDAASQMALVHVRHSYELAIGLKLISAAVLLWLAWMLGRPHVRASFRTLRK